MAPMLGRRRRKRPEVEELLLSSLTFSGILAESEAPRQVRYRHIYVEGVTEDEKVENSVQHLSELVPHSFAQVLAALRENTLIGASLAMVIHRYCVELLTGDAFGRHATDVIVSSFEGEFTDSSDPTHNAVQHVLQYSPRLVVELAVPEEAELVLSLIREDEEVFSRLDGLPLVFTEQLSVYIPLTLLTQLQKMTVQLGERLESPPRTYLDRSVAACLAVANRYLAFEDAFDSDDPMVLARIAGDYGALVSHVLGSDDPVSEALRRVDQRSS